MQRINLMLRCVFVGLLAMACFAVSPALAQQKGSSPEKVQTKKVRVNDVTLNYIERGKGDPVVFVHGTVGDYRTWDGQVEAFSKKYRVISYSRRYHYPNPWPQDASSFSVTVHAKDLVAFIQALKLGRVHLVGHSFGAFIALLVARDNPELIRSLTLGEPPVNSLLATTPQGDSLLQNSVATAIIPSGEAFQSGENEEGVRRFVNGVLGDSAYENLPPHVRAIMMDNIAELKGAVMDKNLFPPFACEDARKVRVPTLLLDGELSPKMLTLVQDILEECLPNKERATILAASHGLEYENPQAFNERVLAFLAQH